MPRPTPRMDAAVHTHHRQLGRKTEERLTHRIPDTPSVEATPESRIEQLLGPSDPRALAPEQTPRTFGPSSPRTRTDPSDLRTFEPSDPRSPLAVECLHPVLVVAGAFRGVPGHGLLDGAELVGCQRDLEGAERLGEPIPAARADERHDVAAPRPHPGDGH